MQTRNALLLLLLMSSSSLQATNDEATSSATKCCIIYSVCLVVTLTEAAVRNAYNYYDRKSAESYLEKERSKRSSQKLLKKS